MTTQNSSSKPTWTPKPYQLRALSLMMKQGSVGLLMDPGLGKTSTSLMAFKILKEKQLVRKALIIAPLRPMYKVWPDEVKKWAEFNDLTYTVLHGPHKAANLGADVDLYIINPEGLKWLFAQPVKPEWDVLVVDESTRFKDSTTQRFKALKPFLPSFSRRWILTGTPVPNGLMDLFGQVYILDLGSSLGRFITHYRQKFFIPTGFGGYEWKLRDGANEEIIEAITPLCLQLSAEEYLQMPQLEYRSITCILPPKVRKIYDTLEEDFITTLESSGNSIVALNAAAAGTKLRQVANGAVYTTGKDYEELHDEKLDALESLLEELNGHSVLILYEFDHDRIRIQQRYPAVRSLSGVSGKALDKLIDQFNSGDIPILLGHPASMGHGLNLQGSCHHVIWYGIPWNLEHYDQAIARVYRQGQRSGYVRVYHLVAQGTKDEEVMKVLTKKDRGQQDVLASIKQRRLVIEGGGR